jgi:hypothetical protein
MTYGILLEKAGHQNFRWVFITRMCQRSGSRHTAKELRGPPAAAEDLIKLWLVGDKVAGEAIDFRAL